MRFLDDRQVHQAAAVGRDATVIGEPNEDQGGKECLDSWCRTPSPLKPLRETCPTRTSSRILRNQALLARPVTRGAGVKQAAMDKQLTLLAIVALD